MRGLWHYQRHSSSHDKRGREASAKMLQSKLQSFQALGPNLWAYGYRWVPVNPITLYLNSQRLIHKIETGSILWMSRSVFLPSNQGITPDVIWPLQGHHCVALSPHQQNPVEKRLEEFYFALAAKSEIVWCSAPQSSPPPIRSNRRHDTVQNWRNGSQVLQLIDSWARFEPSLENLKLVLLDVWIYGFVSGAQGGDAPKTCRLRDI